MQAVKFTSAVFLSQQSVLWHLNKKKNAKTRSVAREWEAQEMSSWGSPQLGSISHTALYFQGGGLHWGKPMTVRTFPNQKTAKVHSSLLMRPNIQLIHLEPWNENSFPILQIDENSEDWLKVSLLLCLDHYEPHLPKVPQGSLQNSYDSAQALFQKVPRRSVLDLKGGCQTIRESESQGSCAHESRAGLVPFPATQGSMCSLRGICD